LGRKNGGDEQLEWILEIQFAMRVGINLRPDLNQLGNAFASGHSRIIPAAADLATPL
jgi:hypothetical protein